jgi:phosphoglycolate phosphatase
MIRKIEKLVVGFDLDMTLVDSHEGITDAISKTLREYGVVVADEEIYQTVGIPLGLVFPKWLPESATDAAIIRYRELYAKEGIPKTTLLPGAADAIQAVKDLGGQTLVVSAKLDISVHLVLDTVGMTVDHVRGSLYAEAKGDALREYGAQIYVGDHVGDVKGAIAANAYAVAVATGPSTQQELEEAGADIVLPSLVPFRSWLEGYVNGTRA